MRSSLPVDSDLAPTANEDSRSEFFFVMQSDARGTVLRGSREEKARRRTVRRDRATIRSLRVVDGTSPWNSFPATETVGASGSGEISPGHGTCHGPGFQIGIATYKCTVCDECPGNTLTSEA